MGDPKEVAGAYSGREASNHGYISGYVTECNEWHWRWYGLVTLAGTAHAVESVCSVGWSGDETADWYWDAPSLAGSLASHDGWPLVSSDVTTWDKKICGDIS